MIEFDTEELLKQTNYFDHKSGQGRGIISGLILQLAINQNEIMKRLNQLNKK